MKVGLGTAQLGLDYGISNPAGRVPGAEAGRILAAAAAAGVRTLDTAAAYGEAEAVLGRLLAPDHGFRVVTKLPRLPADVADPHHWARAAFAASLARLATSSVDGLLLHHAPDLLGPAGAALWAALAAEKDAGRARRIGVSVYGAPDIDGVLGHYPIDLVQLPLSLLDQRLLASGHLGALKAAGVEVHARSLFLQGLLLMEPAALPAHFAPARPALDAFRDAARQAGLTPLAAAVAFAEAVPEVDCAVYGVTRAVELDEIVAAAAPRLPLEWFRPFAVADEIIVNPSKWPKRR